MSSSPPIPKVDNLWPNPTKLKILKDNLGNAPDVRILEAKIPSEMGKTIISHSLKDGSTVISCSNKNNVPALKKIVTESFPTHEISLKNPSKSVIKIVGFKTEYSSEDFFNHLFSKNPSLSSFNSPEHYELISIKSCKKSATTLQAVVKISPNLRKAINENNNKVFISYYRCVVYDQLFVNRCAKCQTYGHLHRECTNVESCAICNGKHQTIHCPHKDDADFRSHKCSNCIREGKDAIGHRADSSLCPCYIKIHENKRKHFLKALR